MFLFSELLNYLMTPQIDPVTPWRDREPQLGNHCCKWSMLNYSNPTYLITTAIRYMLSKKYNWLQLQICIKWIYCLVHLSSLQCLQNCNFNFFVFFTVNQLTCVYLAISQLLYNSFFHLTLAFISSFHVTLNYLYFSLPLSIISYFVKVLRRGTVSLK